MIHTRVLNLYGGPGTGKSTTRAQVFAALKQMGVNAEEAAEFAKDLVWEQRHFTLSQQEYIAAKQIHRVQRLMGQVEVVVTDSPILFSLIYHEAPPEQFARRAANGEGTVLHPDYVRWDAFRSYVRAVHRSWDTLDVFLQRDPTRPYSRVGRNQTEDEAKEIDDRIRALLRQHCPEIHPSMAYRVAQVDKERNSHVDQIVGMVLDGLPGSR